jgi:hypothetical protein
MPAGFPCAVLVEANRSGVREAHLKLFLSSRHFLKHNVGVDFSLGVHNIPGNYGGSGAVFEKLEQALTFH